MPPPTREALEASVICLSDPIWDALSVMALQVVLKRESLAGRAVSGGKMVLHKPWRRDSSASAKDGGDKFSSQVGLGG
jgi:hypothetical protein